METYTIALGDGIVQSFEVAIYPHLKEQSCRNSIFQGSELMACFLQTVRAFFS